MVVNIVYHLNGYGCTPVYEFIGIDGNGVVVFSGHESEDEFLYGEFGRELKKSEPKSGIIEEAIKIFTQEFGLIVNHMIYF